MDMEKISPSIYARAVQEAINQNPKVKNVNNHYHKKHHYKSRKYSYKKNGHFDYAKYQAHIFAQKPDHHKLSILDAVQLSQDTDGRATGGIVMQAKQESNGKYNFLANDGNGNDMHSLQIYPGKDKYGNRASYWRQTWTSGSHRKDHMSNKQDNLGNFLVEVHNAFNPKSRIHILWKDRNNPYYQRDIKRSDDLRDNFLKNYHKYYGNYEPRKAITNKVGLGSSYSKKTNYNSGPYRDNTKYFSDNGKAALTYLCHRGISPNFVRYGLQNGFIRSTKGGDTKNKHFDPHVEFEWMRPANAQIAHRVGNAPSGRKIVGRDDIDLTPDLKHKDVKIHGSGKNVPGNAAKDYGFNFKFGNGMDRIAVFEDPIDGITYAQQNAKKLNKTNTTILSLGGTAKTDRIQKFMESQFPRKGDFKRMDLCFDNDAAGRTAALKYMKKYNNKVSPATSTVQKMDAIVPGVKKNKAGHFDRVKPNLTDFNDVQQDITNNNDRDKYHKHLFTVMSPTQYKQHVAYGSHKQAFNSINNFYHHMYKFMTNKKGHLNKGGIGIGDVDSASNYLYDYSQLPNTIKSLKDITASNPVICQMRKSVNNMGPENSDYLENKLMPVIGKMPIGQVNINSDMSYFQTTHKMFGKGKMPNHFGLGMNKHQAYQFCRDNIHNTLATIPSQHDRSNYALALRAMGPILNVNNNNATKYQKVLLKSSKMTMNDIFNDTNRHSKADSRNIADSLNKISGIYRINPNLNYNHTKQDSKYITDNEYHALAKDAAINVLSNKTKQVYSNIYQNFQPKVVKNSVPAWLVKKNKPALNSMKKDLLQMKKRLPNVVSKRNKNGERNAYTRAKIINKNQDKIFKEANQSSKNIGKGTGIHHKNDFTR